ncbi:MAG: hypothetical protein K8R18_11325 [Parvibaculum sp.]|uniref:hypothetical protein n=1 Tax=Parvibaculum sp. TaxID=2024848 RepID=UPI0025D55A5F|nr:hypothetical protein [Parvibaculum sp.]MCE9650202.1 hypothetical protein [Parvibaculum sp.]
MSGLAACSMMPDWARPGPVYGEGTPAPTQEGTEGFPNLADTPDKKPASTSADDQKNIAEGLSADRAAAKHTDEVLRGGTEPPAPAPQVSAPKPVPALKDVPAEDADPEADKKTEEQPKLLPMPGKGGHSSLNAARRIQTASADMSKDAPDEAADDKPDANAEQPVSAAPTTPVEVKPVVSGGGKAM